MKRLKLGISGKFTLLDDGDYEKVRQWKWFLNPNGYASRKTTIRGKNINIYIHRLLTGGKSSQAQKIVVDHINGNKLDNRKCNLRLVDFAINIRNRVYPCKSGVQGVYWYSPLSKWRAQITSNYKNNHIGYYLTIDEAKEARKKWMLNHLKEMKRVK